MKQTHILHVWGDFACFTRPEFKVERLSYDVMTPSAARSIFECILWKRDDYQNPAFHWVVDRIDILNPVKFISIKRNEVKQGASLGKLFFREDHNTPRNALILKDVGYLLHAHMEFSPAVLKVNPLAPVKYNEMFIRRSTKGQSISESVYR